MGLPTTMAIRTGRGQLAPIGIDRSVPAMPTGTMGTLALKATKAPPRRGANTGPDPRVPSAKSTTGSPAARACSRNPQRFRSGVPRRTGKPPSERKSFAAHGFSKTPDLAMYRRRRRVT